MKATATLLAWPSVAIHSRSAEMAISRPMMISATTMSTRLRYSRTIRAPTTTSLSATGSKNAPKADIWFSLRAR
ncbi:hypothetical protein D3C83_191350 [compost metagenome]